MTASRIRWFAARHPEVWARDVQRVCVPSTYVALELTGEFGVGPGEGSGMFGQLDPDGQFAGDKLDKIDPLLSERVPRVGAVGRPLGGLNKKYAKLLDLAEGTPVAYPEGDQPVGMVASGCMPGVASISLGNSVVFNAVGSAPVLDKRGLVDSFRTADNQHLLMTCMTSGCVVFDELVELYQECCRWLGRKKKYDEVGEWLTAEAAKVPPGCGGVLALPFYKGEGVFRRPQAFATFLGFRDRKRDDKDNLIPGPHSLRAGVLVRASLEATCLTLLQGFREMGLSPLQQIVVSGGGSQNALWPQLIADVFQVPVVKPQNAEEAATRGAAYLAWFMVRRQAGDETPFADFLRGLVHYDEPFQPDPVRSTAYQQLLPRFEQAFQQISPLY